VFYFYQGMLLAANPNPADPIPTLRPIISSNFIANGCSTYGSLAFVEGSSSNKCARSSSFYIQSDQENSQLGAKLVFNWVGGFFACGSGLDVSLMFRRERGWLGWLADHLFLVDLVSGLTK
jgi:hypothetical protein